MCVAERSSSITRDTTAFAPGNPSFVLSLYTRYINSRTYPEVGGYQEFGFILQESHIVDTPKFRIDRHYLRATQTTNKWNTAALVRRNYAIQGINP